MPFEIKEFMGNSIKEINTNNSALNLSESLTSITPISSNSLMVDNEGIHVGATGNYTRYLEEALDSCIESWTKPYLKPVIMFHNEKNGQIIGRVVRVSKKTTGTRSGTPALVFTCNIPDEEGKEKINDGRLTTTSIGVIADDVRCSICGKEIELDEEGHEISCEHEKGEVYEGEVCYWDVYSMRAKELSYVIVPSDMYTHNLRVYSPTEQDIKLSEELIKSNKQVDLKEDLNGGDKMHIDKKLKEEIEMDEKDPKTVVVSTSEPEVKTKTPEEKKKPEETNEPESNEELEAIKEKYKELEAKNQELQNDLEATKLTLSNKVVELEKANGAVSTEKNLREAAENENIRLTKELKENLCENLNILRQGLNKETILTEELQKRNVNSIKDSITDLKEEFNSSFKVKNLQEAQDPTLKTNDGEKNTKKEKILNESVKEKESKGNISLKEEAASIIKELF